MFKWSNSSSSSITSTSSSKGGKSAPAPGAAAIAALPVVSTPILVPPPAIARNAAAIAAAADKLDATQTEALAALKARLAAHHGPSSIIPESFVPGTPAHDKAVAFCTDACLLRYLRAHRWHLEGAAAGIRSTLLWRHEYKPDQISLEDIDSEAEQGTTYVSGFDREGRPILYVKKRGALGDPEKNVKLLTYMLENTIKVMPPGVERLCIIFDFTHYTRANSPPINISVQSLRIVTSHYPERMGAAFFVNAPWVFNILWNVLSPFLDPVTRAKIGFVKCTPGSGLIAGSNGMYANGSGSSSSATLNDIAEDEKDETPASVVDGAANVPPSVAPAQRLEHKTSQMSFTQSQGSGSENAILSIIDADQLEVEYGGTLNFVYNHDIYTRAIESYKPL
ncbi:CRAL-TRIO domain-containing protein [Entophlyctis helioformis]|nr:CRAL-TRIO domain-containing protein [Entophlyctis helioformis]